MRITPTAYAPIGTGRSIFNECGDDLEDVLAQVRIPMMVMGDSDRIVMGVSDA